MIYVEKVNEKTSNNHMIRFYRNMLLKDVYTLHECYGDEIQLSNGEIVGVVKGGIK